MHCVMTYKYRRDMEARQTEMKQWRIVIMVAVSALTILFFVQLGSLKFSKASTSKGNRNKSEPSLKNQNVLRHVKRPSASSSPSNKNISVKLQNAFLKKIGNKTLVKTKDVRQESKIHTHFCWEEEEVEEIGECLRCSTYEKRVSPVCLLTGNKQLVLCKVSKKRVYKSCLHVKWIEERNFWTFEGVSLVFLLISSLSVWQRNKKLDAIYREKLRKKVSNDDV